MFMAMKENIPQTEINDKSERIMNGINIWCSFYRANPHRFVKDYLGINLRIFQQIILFMMNISTNIIYTASRGQGKSYLLAIFCCVRCILYPGTLIVVASKARGQALEIIEKIVNQLMPSSDNLRREISEYSIAPMSGYVKFHNGSHIKIITSNENARHNRANIVINYLSGYMETYNCNRAKSVKAKYFI